MEDFNDLENTPVNPERNASYIMFIPVLFLCFFLVSFISIRFNEKGVKSGSDYIVEFSSQKITSGNIKINILTEEDVVKGIMDTVYTDMQCWLELRIDQQTLYQHWRDGKVEKYLISSGDKFLEKGVESRPGLFAIFVKEEHHQSSQFDNADMYNFMPFNMGIGFHSLDGTGYYGSLGVRPVSHGCIRMRHQDAKKLFDDCPLGTLVLAHRGKTCRTVSFAPKNYKNEEKFEKNDYKRMAAENLYNILESRYYLSGRKFFVIDPKAIPVSGIYIGYDRELPSKQFLPKNWIKITSPADFFQFPDIVKTDNLISGNELLSDTLIFAGKHGSAENTDSGTEQIIKKYYHNPIGILPYFPPDK